jgi:hypothetical protein
MSETMKIISDIDLAESILRQPVERPGRLPWTAAEKGVDGPRVVQESNSSAEYEIQQILAKKTL